VCDSDVLKLDRGEDISVLIIVITSNT